MCRDSQVLPKHVEHHHHHHSMYLLCLLKSQRSIGVNACLLCVRSWKSNFCLCDDDDDDVAVAVAVAGGRLNYFRKLLTPRGRD